MYHVSVLHLLGEGHSGCSHSPTIMNRATINMDEQVEQDAESLGHMPRSGWYSWVTWLDLSLAF